MVLFVICYVVMFLCDFIGKERVGKSVWSGGGDKGKKSKEKGCE